MSGGKVTLRWITADYFLDTDIPVVKAIASTVEIEWHIVLPFTNARYTPSEIANLHLPGSVKVFIYKNNYRMRDIRSMFFFYRVFTSARRGSAGAIYLNVTPSPLVAAASFLCLPSKQTVVTAHQGRVHPGLNFSSILKLSYAWFYRRYKNVHLYSRSEYEKFKADFPSSCPYLIPLGLKDFGYSDSQLSLREVRFLSFGTMRPSKNVRLLVEAACLLYDRGESGFSVTIAGQSGDWDALLASKKYSHLFHILDRQVLNSEIPELFCSHHYAVLPYKIVTQSGPLKIAYNYRVPVIVSDLPGFKEEVEEGISGFFFRSNSVEALAEVLGKAINCARGPAYEILRTKLSLMIEQRYSQKVLSEQYKEMLLSAKKLHNSLNLK